MCQMNEVKCYSLRQVDKQLLGERVREIEREGEGETRREKERLVVSSSSSAVLLPTYAHLCHFSGFIDIT